VEHADKVIDLYDDEKHRHVADLLNQDPKTTAGVCGSISTWVLGYPDRGRRGNPADHPEYPDRLIVRVDTVVRQSCT
jgi:hypothetical protein